MTIPHSIMVIEPTVALRNRIKGLLTKAGFEARCHDVSRHALDDLKDHKGTPYSLIISSYMMPRMKGDEILRKAREISPDSQRLLMADAAEIETLINAVNQAGIHSCLTLPFSDAQLLNRIAYCLSAYETQLRIKSLRSVTVRQNKQLFQIATNLKKKSALYRKQIKEKEKKIRILEARIKSAGGRLASDPPVELTSYLSGMGVPFTKDSFGAQFMIVKEQIKQILEAVTKKNELCLAPVGYETDFSADVSENGHHELVQALWPLILTVLAHNKVPETVSHSFEIQEVVLDDHFEMTLNSDHTQALIKVKSDEAGTLDITHVRQFLEKNGVINGVKSEQDVSNWLKAATPESDAFVIAQGKPVQYPRDAQVRYFFPIDFLHAGKINEDGSINFQDRGEIPHVEADVLLASKIMAMDGISGVDVHGREIGVKAAVDLTFSCGTGTRMSEDGTQIYAEVAGQPHLDALGNVSVCPEYHIKGDLGFETGDVCFEGNVIVNGAVKDGFKVKCATLTANEIQGAQIDIEGDLNVSHGIVDTELVKVKGSVQAKFVRNSKINAFGDLIVQKEIVDSRIFLTGACINQSGSIINSRISAKMGVRAGTIGNESSKPSSLTVGVDEHINLMIGRIDSEIQRKASAINELLGEIRELEKEDQSLHAVISQHAHMQDRSQLQIKNIESRIEALKASGNVSAYRKVVNTVKEIKKNARNAEIQINKGFERQDVIEFEMDQKKGRVRELEELNKGLWNKKERLLEFSGKHPPLPEVKVSGKIEAGTQIFSENSSLTLCNSVSNVRIREHARSEKDTGSMVFHEMKIDRY